MGVSCLFLLKKPNLFLKNATGSLSVMSYLIFWPYFMLNMIALGLFRVFYREKVFDEIVPNLYIGMKLWFIDYQQFTLKGIKSTLDLTSEFGETRFIQTGQNYLCIPLLDTTAPTLDQLTEAISWITAHLSKGPVFIHCALGHGRSATVVAGFLIQHEIVSEVKEAVAFIKAIRPKVSLHPNQLAILIKFTELCKYKKVKRVRNENSIRPIS